MRYRLLVTISVLLMLSCAQEDSDIIHIEPAGAPTDPLPPIPAQCKPGVRVPTELTFALTRNIGGASVSDRYIGIIDYLSRELGIPVHMKLGLSAEETVDLLRHGEVDLVWAPPLAFVKIQELVPCVQLMLTQVSKGTTFYASYLVTRQGGAIGSLDDIQGKRLALVSRDSTSGYLLPTVYLEGRGFDLDKDFSEVVYAGTHIEALHMLLDGDVDVVATYSEVFKPAREEGLDVGQLQILAITGRTPYDAIFAAPHLDRTVVRKVASVLAGLNVTTLDGRRILNRYVDVDGWVYTRDWVYESVRYLHRNLRTILQRGEP